MPHVPVVYIMSMCHAHARPRACDACACCAAVWYLCPCPCLDGSKVFFCFYFLNSLLGVRKKVSVRNHLQWLRHYQHYERVPMSAPSGPYLPRPRLHVCVFLPVSSCASMSLPVYFQPLTKTPCSRGARSISGLEDGEPGPPWAV